MWGLFVYFVADSRGVLQSYSSPNSSHDARLTGGMFPDFMALSHLIVVPHQSYLEVYILEDGAFS